VSALAFEPVPALFPSGTPGPPLGPVSGLHQDQASIIEKLKAQLETTVYRMLMSARSVEEFRNLRNELFQRYVYLSASIGNIVKIEFSRLDLAEVVENGYAILQQRFESDTVLLAGSVEIRRDALYSLDVTHRAHALICQVVESVATQKDSLPSQDVGSLVTGTTWLWFALMHVHATIFAIDNALMPSADVLRELLDGMRTSVHAYEFIREAWGVRFDSTFESIDLSVLKPDKECRFLSSESDREYAHFLDVTPSARP
jgi:hypothetical protein